MYYQAGNRNRTAVFGGHNYVEILITLRGPHLRGSCELGFLGGHENIAVQPCLAMKAEFALEFNKISLIRTHTHTHTHSVSVIKTSQLMLYSEIIAVCSQIQIKHINTLCGQNVPRSKHTPSRL
jgi:hypothetical protein